MSLPSAAELSSRYDLILGRLQRLEQAWALSSQYEYIEARLASLELDTSINSSHGSSDQSKQTSDQKQTISSSAQSLATDISEVQLRLQNELIGKGIKSFRFIRAPPEYYDQPLEFRMEVCGAASIHHLCKALIMVNTRAHESCKGWSDPSFSRYYLVIVQYSARLHTDKLNKFVHQLAAGRCGKANVNMRLCPEEVSNDLSGFEHNAVSPIGIKEQLPMIMDNKILKLDPDFFILGAGEVDLKVGISARDFFAQYQPFVTDLTY